MDIKQRELSANLYEVLIGDVPCIDRCIIHKDIQKGEYFKLYYGDEFEYVKWLANGIGITFHSDIMNAIKASELYQGVVIDSDEFYRAAMKEHCTCHCDEPRLQQENENEVIGVDLEMPSFPRSSSRFIVFKTTCGKCHNDVTYAYCFGGYRATGLSHLKTLAINAAGDTSIDWNSVIISKAGFEGAVHD